MDKIKVLHLRAGSFFGGPERQLMQHVLSMPVDEFDVSVAAFSEGGQRPEFLDRMKQAGVRVKHLPTKSAYDPGAFGALAEYTSELGPQIVCTHDYRTRFLVRYSRLRNTARWIAVSRGWTAENLKIALFNIIDRRIIRKADKIVAVSLALEKQMEHYGIDPGKIAVIQNAIDVELYGDVPAVDLRERFDLPRDAIIAVAAGRFSSEKGHRYLLEEAVAACEKIPRLYLVLYGDGPDLSEMKQLAAKLGIKSRVLFPGFERQLAACLKGSDLLVNPSRSEGLPNIVMEAMAVGLPVVATAVGGVPQLIKNERTGLLTDYGRKGQLCEAIQRLAQEEPLRRRLAEQAGRHIRAEFSVEAQARAWAILYREVLT